MSSRACDMNERKSIIQTSYIDEVRNALLALKSGGQIEDEVVRVRFRIDDVEIGNCEFEVGIILSENAQGEPHDGSAKTEN